MSREQSVLTRVLEDAARSHKNNRSENEPTSCASLASNVVRAGRSIKSFSSTSELTTPQVRQQTGQVISLDSDDRRTSIMTVLIEEPETVVTDQSSSPPVLLTSAQQLQQQALESLESPQAAAIVELAATTPPSQGGGVANVMISYWKHDVLWGRGRQPGWYCIEDVHMINDENTIHINHPSPRPDVLQQIPHITWIVFSGNVHTAKTKASKECGVVSVVIFLPWFFLLYVPDFAGDDVGNSAWFITLFCIYSFIGSIMIYLSNKRRLRKCQEALQSVVESMAERFLRLGYSVTYEEEGCFCKGVIYVRFTPTDTREGELATPSSNLEIV